jgi:ParB-like chromosome segregation protein Spo0J
VSLERFSQYKPIVVQRSTGHILAGNHTYQAAKMSGWTHIAVVFKDCDDATALALMLADNRTSDLGVYDDALLLELAESLPEDLLASHRLRLRRAGRPGQIPGQGGRPPRPPSTPPWTRRPSGS